MTNRKQNLPHFRPSCSISDRSAVLIGALRVTLAAALLTTGCANTATCDPDERLKEGMCFPKPAEAPPNDSGADGAGGPAVCTEDAALTGEFGRTCTEHTECGCPAPICAVPPGQAEGFCTQACTNDPSICPSGYRCIDLSAIDPSYPSTCLPSGLVP